MGACYSTNLKIYVTNETGLVKTLSDYINKGGDGHTNFSLNDWAKQGVYPDNLDDIIKIMLAGWSSGLFSKEVDRDGMLCYSSGFDASYGWEGVMQDMFELMIPYISDISTFMIEPDNDGYLLGIKDGKVVVLKEWRI